VPKRIAILGATGSIGRSTLDVIQHLGPDYRAVALSGHRQGKELLEQVRAFKPAAVALTDDGMDPAIVEQIRQVAKVYVGQQGVVEMVSRDDVDMIVGAIVGAAGLPAVFAAVHAGKEVALANKESLVVAGSLLIPEARKRNVPILPVDSEHSAVFQAIAAGGARRSASVILTASGGPFRTASRERIAEGDGRRRAQSPDLADGQQGDDRLGHHVQQGAGIDRGVLAVRPSAGAGGDRGAPGVDRALDGGVRGRLDDRAALPAGHADADPVRDHLPAPAAGNSRTMDWRQRVALNFEPPDFERFPPARRVRGRAKRGNAGAVMNAANEVAVDVFVAGKIALGRFRRW
jgi:1-deoxy-D-xylulose-5-phosphate reductoisomerase